MADVVEQVTDNSQQVTSISFTELSKQMFNEEVRLPWYESKRRHEVDEGLDSIYEIASANHLTLLEFISDDPEYAVMCVEMSYAKWTNVLTQAALTGAVTTSEGSIAITKNQIKAIEIRIKQAKYELDLVTDYAIACSGNNEKKRDQLLRTLYMNAIMHRDTKAIIYLIDRLDGRPGEARVAELSYDNAYNIYMILHTLFDKQLNVLNAGCGTILVCCSRRAGKTHMLVAASLIECMRKPNTTCVYIGETMDLTEGLIDKAANIIIDECHLQDRRGKRFNWKHMDNGSEILVRGLSNTKDPDLIRGNNAKIIVIDEFFHLKSDLLEYLQSEVLQPMQMDYADDYKFICAGTPPQVKGTYGEYAWKNWDVPHFQWTWRDNPHPVSIEAREEYVENVLREKGLTWDTPFARREYLGQWAYDDDLLLYPDYKTYDPDVYIPAWKISRIFFGIDYGVGDFDTIVGIAWSDDEGSGYEMFETKFNRCTIKNDKITQLEYLKKEVMKAWEKALGYFDTSTVAAAKRANKFILWDADDNDQHVTQELAVNCTFKDDEILEGLSLQIGNAHKTDKTIMWDKIAELMRTGRLLIIENGLLQAECDATIMLRGPNGEIYSEIDDKAFHPDLLPAMRYALWNVIGV